MSLSPFVEDEDDGRRGPAWYRKVQIRNGFASVGVLETTVHLVGQLRGPRRGRNDDFYGWMPYDTLLRLCDRYPLLIETKGGQTIFLAKTIIITSNNTPAQWYKNVNLKAFIRRVDLWIYLGLGGLRVETENYDEFCNAVDRNFIN